MTYPKPTRPIAFSDADQLAADAILAKVPQDSTLAIPASLPHRNHNIWNNNGSWSIAFTVHTPGYQVQRIRKSLSTGSLSLARHRRDLVLAALGHADQEEEDLPNMAA